VGDCGVRYERLELLGEGSLGRVYRARDRETGEQVALKTLDRVGADHLYHLKREFRTLSTLRHPSLVVLHELVVDGTDCFFTMELVEGADFVGWVRGGDADLTGAALGRFFDAAVDLAEALAAVHRAGRLHRDVKPANVRVRADGRVVLLDFDLALELDLPRVLDDAESCVGTYAYMAPDQAFGQPIGPAADWYAFGGMLYEALTGRLPFDGASGSVMLRKARARPPGPRTLCALVPPALDALVERLLDPAPERRPDETEIRTTLTALRGDVPIARESGGAPLPFVGRHTETAVLEAVLERRGTDLDVVHVHGLSGIGKSELVRRTLRRLESAADTIVLRGRCHDRESVPYKAFDTIVDGLSSVVRAFAPEDRHAFVPADSAALVRMFPVLARVPELGRAEPFDAEPTELRRRAFGALRELLTRLGGAHRMVLWIDDLQWADVDSSALLEALARPPDPPPLALVLSYRSEDRDHIPLLAMLRSTPDVAASVRETTIALGPLSGPETVELARAMAPAGARAEPQVARIAEEAGGSPFFVGELARHMATGGTDASVPPTLEDAMRERVSRLDDAGRGLLELVAVAGGPIDRAIAIEAAGGVRLRAVAFALEQQSLLRSTATAERVLLEVYHDRLRVLVAGLAAPAAQAARHGQIAAALARTPDADPRDLFRHYDGAGDREGARRVVLAAAEASSVALAFHRAAELYRRALELDVDDPCAVRAKLAGALVDAGLGPEAARTFEALAAMRAEAGASADEIARLRRRTAEQYLQSGHLTEGMAAIRLLLDAIGMRPPRTSVGSLVWFLRERRRLLRRGFAFTACDPATIPAATLDRLDTCFAASAPLSMTDPIVAGAIATRATREALDAGHRAMVVRLLATMANREAVIGTRAARRRGEEILAMVERLAVDADPYERATVHLSAGATAFIEGRWAAARDRCHAAIALWEQGCRGVAFEISVARVYELAALAFLGDLRALATEMPAVIADADARGALGLSMGLRLGQPALVWLVEDRPDVGRRLADHWIGRWPSDRVLIPHYTHAIAVVQSHLYERDGAAAWARTQAVWASLRRAGFLLQVSSRLELLFLRARAAIVLAAAGGDDRRARRLLRRAARDATAMARMTSIAHADGYAATIAGAVAGVEGRTTDAGNHLERAAASFERSGMLLHRAAATRALGLVRGEASLVAAADEWLRAQGVRRPDAMAAVIVPGRTNG
jgi:tetratricopeptide (TPR) repeat protein